MRFGKKNDEGTVDVHRREKPRIRWRDNVQIYADKKLARDRDHLRQTLNDVKPYPLSVALPGKGKKNKKLIILIL